MSTDMFGVKSMTDYTSQLVEANTKQKVTNKAASAQTDEELLDACKEFETYLWEQVIKSMKNTTSLFGEEDSSSQMVDVFMDTAVTELASKFTESSQGPGSLAQQMFEQMKRTQSPTVIPTKTED